MSQSDHSREEPSKKRVCIYCGERADTVDHVPPRNIFDDKEPPPNLITVPACFVCNNGAAKDDEYFRDAIVMREDAGEHPVAAALWDNKVHRAIKRAKDKGFATPILKDVKLRSRLTSGGIYVTEPVYGVETARIERVLNRIVKGLFYHELRRRLPSDYTVGAIMVGADSFHKDKDGTLTDEIKDLYEQMNSTPWKPTGGLDSTFGYKFNISSDDENTAFVFMVFYGQLVFLGITCKIS